MSSTYTLYNLLRKPEHRDPETYESWDQVINDNLDIIDSVLGVRTYTEQNYISNSDTHSQSLDKLDMELLDTNTDIANLIINITNNYITKTDIWLARKAVLFPEFDGATFTLAPGGANLGTLTTDKEDHSDFYYNHYKWISTEVTLQSYDIVVQWRVPETFKNFNAAVDKALIVDIATSQAAVTNNKVDVILSKDSLVSATSTIINKFSTPVAANWYSEREGNELIAFDATDPILSSLSAGDTLNVVIRMYSQNSGEVKIGAITIQYTG
jgi:hypothetical protein